MQDCLRALLAVLMNMTQNNAAGCEAVVAAGVLAAAAPVLAQIAEGGPRNKGGWVAVMGATGGRLCAWLCGH